MAMAWAKIKAACEATEYERVKRVVEEILDEKFAPPSHLLPRGAQEVCEEVG